MSVNVTDLRVGFIEDTWQEASGPARLGYIEELGEIADALEHLTAAQAERGRWLTRRVQRVTRQITGHLGPGATPAVDD